MLENRRKASVHYSDVTRYQLAHLGVRERDCIEWRLTNETVALPELVAACVTQFYRATLLYPTGVRVGWPQFTDELMVIATTLNLCHAFPADLDVASLPDGRPIAVHLDHSLGPHTAVAEYMRVPDTDRLNVRTLNVLEEHPHGSTADVAVAS